MGNRALIVGAGIAGLACATACTRAGWTAEILEKTGQLSEAGAGIQLGPNVTRILTAWGLERALRSVAAFPKQLIVRDAASGMQLGSLSLAEFRGRYGAPYVTLHRADLQQLLLDAALAAGTRLRLAARVASVEIAREGVAIDVAGSQPLHADILVAADGLWSRVREQLFNDGVPDATGHAAYRALGKQAGLPDRLRQDDICVWLGPGMHVVAYPLRGAELLNVVVVVEGAAGDQRTWDEAGSLAEIERSMGPACTLLRDLLQALDGWRRWTLHARPPLRDATQMASGRAVVVGDAAHPMLPYFAQGAGMAIEDAQALGCCLRERDPNESAQSALARFADRRWLRNARVQRLSARNGRIFHARGPLRWGRDWSMKLLGERLLDQPWLYR